MFSSISFLIIALMICSYIKKDLCHICNFPSFCQQIMGYSDTDVAEYVFSARPSIDQLVKFLCKDLSKTCSVKPPPVPAVIGCNSYFKIVKSLQHT